MGQALPRIEMSSSLEALLQIGHLSFFFINLFILFIYFWLHWVFVAAQAFSSCGERGLLFVAVRGLLTAMASCCRAQALGAWASVVVARGLSSCGTRAQ